jgi:hypothetical protein
MNFMNCMIVCVNATLGGHGAKAREASVGGREHRRERHLPPDRVKTVRTDTAS